ncbi:MAG: hypothetical protein Q9164_007977, partial [Protoblastenia rupestris]
NWKARMDNPEVELDECLPMRSYDVLDGIQGLDVSSFVFRIFRQLPEVVNLTDFAERTSAGSAFPLRIVIRPEVEESRFVFSGGADVPSMAMIL